MEAGGRIVSRLTSGTRIGLPLATVLFTLVLGSTPRWVGAQEITVMTWAGAWEEAARAIVAQFERQSPVKVRLELQQNMRFGLAKLRAQRDDPQVDVWFSVPDGLEDATNDGLLQPLAVNELPNVRSLPDAARHRTWVEVGHDVYGIIYRKDLVPFEPKTIEDLLDARLKSKVLSPTASYASGLWIVYSSLVNGGSDRNVEPGFEYLRKLKPSLARFYTTGPEAMKLLQSGEAAVFPFGLFANLRPHLGQDSPYKFVLPKGPVFTTTYSVAIASPKRKAQAMQFVDFLATAQAQTLYCDKVLCIPTNPAARAPQAAEEFRPDPARLYRPDLQLINKSLPAWDDRFKKEIQSR
jgi:putative spermidine/putrescine transport system substrate-binding protein